MSAFRALHAPVPASPARPQAPQRPLQGLFISQRASAEIFPMFNDLI